MTTTEQTTHRTKTVKTGRTDAYSTGGKKSMKLGSERFPTLGAAFLHRCQTASRKVGFRYKQDGKWIDVTYGEQFDYIRSLSAGMMKAGLKPNDHVAVIANTSLLWGRLEFAAMGTGAIVVPIYPTNTPEDVEYILNHAEIKFLFCDSLQALEKTILVWKNCPKLERVFAGFSPVPEKVLGDYAAKIATVNDLFQSGVNAEPSLGNKFEQIMREQKTDDLYTICYTSGTTGVPKGVMLAQSCMMSALNDTSVMIEGMAFEGDDLLSFLPMSHIFGRFESYTPYVQGFIQNFAESIDTIVANMQEIKPTLFMSVPRIFEKAYTRITEMMANESPAKQMAFSWAMGVGKKWIAGGAPLPHAIGDFMEIAGVPIYEGYGLTETCAPVSVNTPNDNKPGTVGKLYPDILVRIAEDGEILIKGGSVFTGYYKNPEATAEALHDGWFFTGDIGHLDEDGYLLITDRKKDLIKTAGGKFVAPQKIENIAKTSSVINQVVVYGDQKPFITALVTLHQEAIIKFAKKKKVFSSKFTDLVKNPEVEAHIQAAIEEINAQLPRWETIKKFHVLPAELTVEAGELTPSLKVKRKLLTKKYQDVLEALYK